MPPVGWQHALTMPRELKVINNKVYQLPLEEMKELRGNAQRFHIKETNSLEEEDRSFKLILNFEEAVDKLNIKLRKDVTLDYLNNIFTLSLGESGYGRDFRSATIKNLDNIKIFSDNSSLEIFLNGVKKYSQQESTIKKITLTLKLMDKRLMDI